MIANVALRSKLYNHIDYKCKIDYEYNEDDSDNDGICL